MNFYRKISISAAIASLLLCGSAFAKKPSAVEVVNTPDVNVINDVNNPVPVEVTATPSTDLANHVELLVRGGVTACVRSRAFYRKGMDGVVNSEEFVVPDDYALLITDISWVATVAPTSFIPGRSLRLTLQDADPNGANIELAFISSPVEITVENQFALLGGTDSLHTGILIGSGRIVCPNVTNNNQTSFSSNLMAQGFLRGKLVPIDP